MKLQNWLQKEGVGPLDFAKRIGLAHGTSIYRYLDGRAIPRAKFMARIVVETRGQVTPADFYADRLNEN